MPKLQFTVHKVSAPKASRKRKSAPRKVNRRSKHKAPQWLICGITGRRTEYWYDGRDLNCGNWGRARATRYSTHASAMKVARSILKHVPPKVRALKVVAA